MIPINLTTVLGRLKLKNPVLVASGTFGYGKEFEDLTDIKGLGAIISKTVTLNPRQGNAPPRIAETPSGMLNAVGLQNEGLENFIAEKLPFLRKAGTPVIVSVGGEKADEFPVVIKRLEKEPSVAAYEINVSCPNIHYERQTTSDERRIRSSYGLIAQDAKAVYDLLKSLRKLTKRTIITKLSPNVTDITEIAKAAEDAGSDAVSLINTLLGMKIDLDKGKPFLGNITGGLSGPAIRPVAVRMVYETYKAVNIPIIGMGGIMGWQDALEFILAGASAVCVGTANLVNPDSGSAVVLGLEKYLLKNKIRSIRELAGAANR